MPYRGMTALTARITEDCVRGWATELNPHSRNYLYYFKYLDWSKAGGYWESAWEMLNDHAKHSKSADEREQYKHVDVLATYVKGKGTGSNDRRQTYHAVSGFYANHRRPLPDLPRNEAEKLFKPSERDAKRAVELQPLQPEEDRQLILHAPMPYKAVFAVMFQGAVGLAEFIQFNANWQKIAEELDKPGPIKVDLYRSKTSRKQVNRYYTFISEDAKILTRQWLQMRPTLTYQQLFLTYRKNDGKWVPVSRLVPSCNRRYSGARQPLERRNPTANAVAWGTMNPTMIQRAITNHHFRQR